MRRRGALAGPQAAGSSLPRTRQTVTGPLRTIGVDRAARRGASPPRGGDRVVGMDEVEEGGGDQVVEMLVVDRGTEGAAGRDRVEGAVRALLPQVDDAVGEVGPVEAVLEEAGGGARRGRCGRRRCRAPSGRRSRGSCPGCSWPRRRCGSGRAGSRAGPGSRSPRRRLRGRQIRPGPRHVAAPRVRVKSSAAGTRTTRTASRTPKTREGSRRTASERSVTRSTTSSTASSAHWRRCSSKAAGQRQQHERRPAGRG